MGGFAVPLVLCNRLMNYLSLQFFRGILRVLNNDRETRGESWDGNEITQHLEILRRQGCNQFETCGELERLRLTRPFHGGGGEAFTWSCARQ